ncbi:MAG: hypothetical protein Q8O67_32770 [Deltaproteobacteria bacterium]|nr:hypothetical protein [Deltaproteobacteria bacterium]
MAGKPGARKEAAAVVDVVTDPRSLWEKKPMRSAVVVVVVFALR